MVEEEAEEVPGRLLLMSMCLSWGSLVEEELVVWVVEVAVTVTQVEDDGAGGCDGGGGD